jgi:RHS repeat-associated protein
MGTRFPYGTFVINLTADGGNTTYAYNALNQRVRTVVGSATTDFVFDASGERVSEWNAATHAQLEGNYYWQGKTLAYYTTAADTSAAVGIHFEHQNYLGTERMRTMPTGPYNSSSPNYAVEANFAEQPFGDNKQTFPGTVIETSFDTDANHYAFLDTDKETATDHADFRQYSNAQGRWMAPDPYDGSYDIGNPQSLNRYVYAMNSPLSYLDPIGLDCVTATESGVPIVNPGDCPGRDPNNEYYWDCDGCLVGATFYQNTSNGDLMLVGTDGQMYDLGSLDYTAPVTSSPNPALWLLASGFVYPGANAAAQAARAAAQGRPTPTPSPIPRPVLGPNPVPPQLPPGEIPEIAPGASWGQKIGITILNIVKGFGQGVQDFVVVPTVVLHRPYDGNYCGSNNPDCES